MKTTSTQFDGVRVVWSSRDLAEGIQQPSSMFGTVRARSIDGVTRRRAARPETREQPAQHAHTVHTPNLLVQMRRMVDGIIARPTIPKRQTLWPYAG